MNLNFNISEATGVTGEYPLEYDSGYENSGYHVINIQTLYGGTDFSSPDTTYDVATSG